MKYTNQNKIIEIDRLERYIAYHGNVLKIVNRENIIYIYILIRVDNYIQHYKWVLNVDNWNSLSI